MSKLASVQKITNISSIEGADNIEVADILGWKVVVRKGEFKEGQLVGYVQIDTIVPETEQFEFLRERKFRVRTIKLRKQISQGLIIPLPKGSFVEDEDITDLIGVKKYEKEQQLIEDRPKKPKIWYKRLWYEIKFRWLVKWFPSLKQVNRASFPTHLVSITDEERIQNFPHVLEQFKGKQFVVSEKLDGSSITIIHESSFGKSKFRICSRRFELFNKSNDWYRVFESTGFKEHILKLVDYYKTNDIIVQGEAIGKFNGNRYNLVQDDIRLFNIFVNKIQLKQDEFYKVCKSWNIPVCPYTGTIVMNYSLEDIIKASEGKSVLNNQVEREGLVYRCIEHPLSFKVINNQYLLKYGE